MKKTYMTPALTTVEVQVQQMMALSLQTGKADGSDALVKGAGDWDIFGDDASADADDDAAFDF